MRIQNLIEDNINLINGLKEADKIIVQELNRGQDKLDMYTLRNASIQLSKIYQDLERINLVYEKELRLLTIYNKNDQPRIDSKKQIRLEI